MSANNHLLYRGYVVDKGTGLYYLQSRYYDPNVGRFINADKYFSGVGGDILGDNMFAYCFNNPVNLDDIEGNWPQCFKKAVKWVAEKVIKPVVKKVQKALGKRDFTYSTGIGTGGSITGYGIQVQGGFAFDSKGNIAIQGTAAGGFSTTAGCLGIVYNSLTNAPDVSALEGSGYQMGGVYGWNIGYVPVVAGGDINFIPIPDSEAAYIGGTFITGFGTSGFEGHVDWTYTGTLPYSKVNIFEAAEIVYHVIMEW